MNRTVDRQLLAAIAKALVRRISSRMGRVIRGPFGLLNPTPQLQLHRYPTYGTLVISRCILQRAITPDRWTHAIFAMLSRCALRWFEYVRLRVEAQSDH